MSEKFKYNHSVLGEIEITPKDFLDAMTKAFDRKKREKLQKQAMRSLAVLDLMDLVAKGQKGGR